MPASADHLKIYSETHDERAFRALVEAHLGMVFGTAMRRLGDRGLSEEISQNVFTALAKKAGGIRSSAALPAWLHRATVLECSKAIRGESRRRMRMEKLIEINALEGEGLAAWKHAAQDLDEAFDELPTADRELLFQRFYNDKSLKEIAGASGKSVAAAQKQASRALGKLGELMRARGFAVPVTVLASALGAEFVKAAPVSLAASISTTAFASTISTGLMAAMSITKTTAVGVAAGLMLVSAFTAGGYISGRESAQSKIARQAEAVPEKSVITALKKIQSKESTAAETKERGSVRELLLAAADHYNRGQNDPLARNAGRRLLAKLEADEITAALAELESLELDKLLFARMRWAIVGHWASFDGAAATAYALENASSDCRNYAMTAVLSGWSQETPTEAYAWFRAAQANGEINFSEQRNLLRTLMRSWAEKDPTGALAVLATLDYDEHREAARSLGRMMRDEETRVPFLEALKKYPEPKLRSNMIDDAMDGWSKIDPVAAAAWFDTVEFESENLAFEPAAELAENWFEVDARAAVDWLWAKTPEHMRKEFVEKFVREGWVEKDPKGAANWLEANGFQAEGKSQR